MCRQERAIHGSGVTVIGRRALLATGAALTTRQAAAALPIPSNRSLVFRLMRHGSVIGQHALAFEPKADTVIVRIVVEARVSLLSIPVVHYTHRVVETWDNGILSEVTGDTDKNGRTEWVRAHRTSEGLLVQGSRTEQYIAPEPAYGTSYWNKNMLDGPMISMEDGVLLRPKITPRPAENIPLASGAVIAALRYDLSGSFNVDVWYDRSDTWASLAFTAADGSETRYERL